MESSMAKMKTKKFRVISSKSEHCSTFPVFPGETPQKKTFPSQRPCTLGFHVGYQPHCQGKMNLVWELTSSLFFRSCSMSASLWCSCRMTSEPSPRWRSTTTPSTRRTFPATSRSRSTVHLSSETSGSDLAWTTLSTSTPWQRHPRYRKKTCPKELNQPWLYTLYCFSTHSQCTTLGRVELNCIWGKQPTWALSTKHLPL